jgi:hypothetical protein
MKTQLRRFALYAAIGVTILMVMFPPFVVAGRLVEYGFVLSGPPTARQAAATAAMFGGGQMTQMAHDIMPYSIDVARLLIQLVVVWGTYFAAARTVMKAA